MAPGIIFGTASFGMDMTDFQDPASVEEILRTLQELGIRRLDSGARYPPRRPGRAEALIGQTELSKAFVIDTKVYTNTMTDGGGDLTATAIEDSMRGSLHRLSGSKVNQCLHTGGSVFIVGLPNSSIRQVNILHAHRADPSTPLEEQIRGFNQQIQKGSCNAVSLHRIRVTIKMVDKKNLKWGVSNVAPEMLEQMLRICDDKGL